jgi:uncharacterized membrane protein
MRRSTNERGAVAIMTALFLVIVVGVASLAVDLGMQRVGKRDMQALSDLVALDMARQLDGNTAVALTSSSTWSAKFSESRARNAGSLGTSPVVTIEVGTLDAATRAFTVVPNGSTSVPNAVRVTSSTSVSFAFHPGSGGVIASSIAAAVKSACFKLGSYAARFSSGDFALISTLISPMNELIRPSANLGVLDYQGIAATSVSINELVATGQLGTTTQFLGSSVTALKLLQATVSVLGAQSPPNSVAIAALNKIINGQASLATPILMSKVLSISPTDTAALATKFNVLDLITGAILAADGTHAINIPNLSANVGNLAPVTASGYIIENPQLGCGVAGSAQAKATTSQVHLEAQLKLQPKTINGITGVTGVVQTPESAVAVLVNVGAADGALISPEPVCNAGTLASPDTETVSVSSGLTTLSLTTTLHFTASLNVLGVGNVDASFDLAATAAQGTGTPTTANLKIPPNDTTPVSTGSPGPLGAISIATVATNVSATTKVLGIDVPVLGGALTLVVGALGSVTSQLAVNAALTGPLNGLIDNVNSVLSPLQSLLGIRLAGADVYAVNRPTCNGAALRG